MIPNQYRRPSVDVVETASFLLAAGQAPAAVVAMEHAITVLRAEREQARADRDAAMDRLNQSSPTHPIRNMVEEVFAPSGDPLADVVKFLSRPSDYTKAN